jgi:DNA end-binding protein Ku
VAVRAYWKGYLKLSLVSCPISLFPATSERERIHFHQINKKTGNRIKYKKVDAETNREVDTDDIVKGYEVGKNDFIELEPDELDAVALESTRVIEIDQFVPAAEIDELYLDHPYYIVPDGEVGAQAFAVIREAIRKEGMVALGKSSSPRASMSWRSSRAAMVSWELRFAILTRCATRRPISTTFQTKRSLKTCSSSRPTSWTPNAGGSTPSDLRDHYEDALKDLLRKKKKGEKIERQKEPAPSNVVDLMEALRQSVGASRQRKAASHGKAARRAGRQSSAARSSAARQKKAS